MILLIIYGVLSVASIIIGARAYAIGNKRLQNVQLVISIIAGVCVAILSIMEVDSTSVGLYIYRINGVEVSSTLVFYAEVFFIFLVGAALPNIIGMGIGSTIANHRVHSLLRKIGGVLAFLLADFLLCYGGVCSDNKALISGAILMAVLIVLFFIRHKN